MSTIIKSNSKNPFYVQDNVPSESPSSYTATVYAETASNIIVYVAPATATVQVPIDLRIVGSGLNASLRTVSLGVNRSFVSATNSVARENKRHLFCE
jgi:hypothetical protein